MESIWKWSHKVVTEENGSLPERTSPWHPNFMTPNSFFLRSLRSVAAQELAISIEFGPFLALVENRD